CEVPGGALFRSEYKNSHDKMTEEARLDFDTRTGTRFTLRGNDRSDFGLYSGGRALEENLQLDLVLAIDENAAPQLEIETSTLMGVTIDEIDWAPYLEGVAPPTLDALASRLPADNMSIFFPSFDAMAALVDEAERLGNPIADLASNQAENQRTRTRV